LKCCTVEGTKVNRFVFFQASDRFDLGTDYNYVDKKKPAKEVEWTNCPMYCGGFFCQFPSVLKAGDAFGLPRDCCLIDTSIVKFCCKKNKWAEEKEKDETQWVKATEIQNEIVITLHYRHLVDKQVKTCKLVIKPSETEKVDDVYVNARTFVLVLSKARMPLGHTFKDYDASTRSTITTGESEQNSFASFIPKFW